LKIYMAMNDHGQQERGRLAARRCRFQLRGTANMLQRVSTGQTSGVLALHDARAYSGIFSLQDAWLELPMSGETHPVLSNVTVLTTSTLDVPDAGAVAEISTLAGNGARLVKQGAGRLSAGIGFESALDLEIAQGSVALPRPVRSVCCPRPRCGWMRAAQTH
jgi:hypothetical protein